MKILFVLPKMMTGGVERSLICLMKHLSKNNDVFLYLLANTGGMFSQIPQDVKIISKNKTSDILQKNDNKVKKVIRKIFSKTSKALHLYNFLFNVYYKSVAKKFMKSESKILIDEDFDIAVSFNGFNFFLNQFILKNVKAKKRFVFLHGDVNYASAYNWVFSFYNAFDKVFLVSNSCMQAFNVKYPKIANNTDYIYNLQDENDIFSKSELFDPKFEKNCFNIVSVSRLSEEKAYLRNLKIALKLKEENYKFCWHIIGSGPDEEQIKNYIKKKKLENYVRLYGNKENPYPYIKKADLFFLGSYHEAAPMVFNETKILGTPILTTKVISAKEIISDLGFICENNKKDIYKSFKKILEDKKLLDSKKEKLKTFSYKNEKAQNIEKIDKIFS